MNNVVPKIAQIASETVEKTVQEGAKLVTGIISGQELVGDAKLMGEAEMNRVKAEDERKKQEEMMKLKNIPGRNVEGEIEAVRDEKKRIEEEQEKQFLENIKRQREAEEAERQEWVEEPTNSKREAAKTQFAPGKKRKSQPDLQAMSQTAEVKGKVD